MKILLILFCIFFFFACSKPNDPPPPSLLVGDWNEISESDSIFAANGSILYDSTFFLSNTDLWSFRANGTDSSVSTIEISPNYNTMVFTIVHGQSIRTGHYVLNGDVIAETDAGTGRTININIQYLTTTQLLLYFKGITITSSGTYAYCFRTKWEKKK